MSAEQRLKKFSEQVVDRHLMVNYQPSYQIYYRQLVLIRRVTELVVSSLLIFSGQQFLIQDAFFSPAWYVTGAALSAIFLRGNTLLIGIFLGSFTSYLYNRFTFELAFAQSLLFVAYLYILRASSLALIGAVTPFFTVRVLWQFFLLVSLFTAIHTGLLLNISLKNPIDYFYWFTAWAGEINGIFSFVPLCLMFDPFVPQKYFQPKICLWWIASLIIILCHFGYFFVPCSLTPILAFFLLLLLCLYAKLFGPIPTSITLLATSVVGFSGVMAPLALFHDCRQQETSLLFALFMLTTITSLSVAVMSKGSGNK